MEGWGRGFSSSSYVLTFLYCDISMISDVGVLFLTHWGVEKEAIGGIETDVLLEEFLGRTAIFTLRKKC